MDSKDKSTIEQEPAKIPKCKPCCACPETRTIRDKCVFDNGEENCSNASGQLSLSHTLDVDTFSSNSNNINIIPISIGLGANHTVIVSNKNTLYVCGKNTDGQLGLSTKVTSIIALELLSVESNGNIILFKRVSCGFDFTIALSITGHVWAFGSNKFGQLGISCETNTLSTLPAQIYNLPTITATSCGLYFTIALDIDGNVWGWGLNKHGELGIDRHKTTKILYPQIIIRNCHITQIACGQHHIMALTKENKILTMGWNKFGQLGAGALVKDITTPFALSLETLSHSDLIVQIFCGWGWSGVLTNSGNVYVWGRCDKGQLGMDIDFIEKMYPQALNPTIRIAICWTPVKVMNLTNIKYISAGSENGFAIDTNGYLIAWGWNEHGNCGLGHTDDVKLPSKVLKLQIIENIENSQRIACGYGHSFLYN